MAGVLRGGAKRRLLRRGNRKHPGVAGAEHLPYEVFRRVAQQRSENDALQAVAVMEQGRVVDEDAPTALSAARISLDRKLPMADSVILAIARHNKAVLWTQDGHFKGLEDVRFKEAAGR
jgi:predicted nucleic acid-binding protein